MSPQAKKLLLEAGALSPNDRLELLCGFFARTSFVEVDAAAADLADELEDRRGVLQVQADADSGKLVASSEG